jgi:hypothetical protein
MMFVIKAEVSDPRAERFAFSAQKTMYCGKHIAKGDTLGLSSVFRRSSRSEPRKREL